jgi:ubiquinone/menaquinone biosynthesis C-methylase UbiE
MTERKAMARFHGSDRQRREIEYHRQRAIEYGREAATPVSLTALQSARYRWWNAYWVILRKAKNLGLANKRVLVIGCGFGDDAVQLAWLGALVTAIDISEELVAIARQRAHISGAIVEFGVSAAENLPYADEIFDLVYLPDVVHHLDVLTAMREVRRVLKPGGTVLGNEPYTHSWIQAVRQSSLVRDFIYPRMVRRIYGTQTPYITADERKLDQHDFWQIENELRITERHYFLLVCGRLLPPSAHFQAVVDRVILMMPLVGYFLAGRIVFAARRPQRRSNMNGRTEAAAVRDPRS